MNIEHNLDMKNDPKAKNKLEKDKNKEKEKIHNPNVKLTGSLKSEYTTIIILRVLSILCLIASLLLEYIGKKWISCPVKISLHIDFVVNLLLGCAVSAFVTYTSLVVPYRQRREKQVNNILTRLKDIYFHYTDIYNSISDGHYDWSFIFEKQLIEKVNGLVKEIDDEIIAYNNAEFTSRDIKTLNRIIKENIIGNLETINIFCLYLYNHNQSTVNSDLSGDLMESMINTEKSPLIKHVQAKCYQFLSNTIDQNYSYTKLTDKYQSLLGPESTEGYSERVHSDKLDFLQGFRDAVNIANQYSKINNGIGEILSQFNEEAIELLGKSDEIYDKMGELGMTSQSFIDKRNKVNTLIDKNELEEARQLLNNLEKEIENYNEEIAEGSSMKIHRIRDRKEILDFFFPDKKR